MHMPLQVDFSNTNMVGVRDPVIDAWREGFSLRELANLQCAGVHQYACRVRIN